MGSDHLAVTVPPTHAKSDSISTSNSEQSVFSFQTGATVRANLNTTTQEDVTGTTEITDAKSTERTSVPDINDGSKATSPWNRLKTTVRRRNTVQPTTGKIMPTESDLMPPADMLRVQKSPAMLSLPELPQRRSLVEEINATPPGADQTLQDASKKAPNANDSLQLRSPSQSAPKVCTKCGKRKRPKLVTRELSNSTGPTRSRTTLAVIAEAPTEPPPLKSPTNFSDASTVCVPERPSDDISMLGKSSIYNIAMHSDFDEIHLVPDKVMSIPPRSTSGLSFITTVPKEVPEEHMAQYTPEEDESGDGYFPDSLSVPDTAALDKILRDMQDLINRTNSRLHTISEYDIRASPIPREIV